MMDTLHIFSDNQAITVSTVSNYAGTGAGSAGPGVLDLGLLIPSPGGSGGFGQMGVLGGSPIKFNLIVSVGQLFIGPAGTTLVAYLQDSADNLTYANTMLGNVTGYDVSTLLPGLVLINAPLPAIDAQGVPGALREFLRMAYTVGGAGGGPFTGGTINARLEVM